MARAMAAYQDTAEHYKLKVNGNPVDIAFNKSLVLESKKQLQAVLAKNDTLMQLMKKFKNITGTTIINQYTTIKGDTIRMKDSIPCDFKPFQVRRDSLYYRFLGTIGPTFFSIDSLVIPNTQSIVIGEKKLGFFKGTEKRLELINSNPLVYTNKIQNYLIQPRKRLYQKTGFQLAIGFIAGSVATWKLIR